MKHLISILLLLFLCVTIFANTPTIATSSSVNTQSKELRIIRITPQGSDIPPGRQVVIEFNRPVVPIGRMQRTESEIPAKFTPSVNCQWRWLNTSALSCNLPVNRQLATTSMVDADQGNFKAAQGSIWFKFNDWVEYNVSFWSFYHQELHNDAVQFYADYLPAGNYHLSYTAQAIASGQFTVMPIKAEEMYDSDVFGRGVIEKLNVAF